MGSIVISVDIVERDGRQGRVDRGAVRSAVEQADLHDQEEQRFLLQLAARLDKAILGGETKSLTVVAPPPSDAGVVACANVVVAAAAASINVRARIGAEDLIYWALGFRLWALGS